MNSEQFALKVAPTRLKTDFEQAAIRVIQFEFPNDYMALTWVDYDARFPILLWNHHDTSGPRTNNNMEGFHNKLTRSLPHQHPNIYRLIEVFEMIEKADKVKLAQ